MLTVSLFEVIIMVGTSYRNHGSAHTLLFVSQFSVEAEENLKATEFLRTWFGFFFFFFVTVLTYGTQHRDRHWKHFS